jgi:release factor glutamine methyltransferase
MEPSLALDGGDDGLHIIRKIISRAPEFLCKGGSLLLEADPRQMATIASLYKEAGFSDIQTHADLSGKERVICGIKSND